MQLGVTDSYLVHMCRTNKFFVRKVRAAADSTCKHKVLMAYSPHAPRNRPKQTVGASDTLAQCEAAAKLKTIAA